MFSPNPISPPLGILRKRWWRGLIGRVERAPNDLQEFGVRLQTYANSKIEEVLVEQILAG